MASNFNVWKENKSEGNSLYILDPDGHKFEIHVSDWKTRLQVYHSDLKMSQNILIEEKEFLPSENDVSAPKYLDEKK